jgi:hypothetical protein
MENNRKYNKSWKTTWKKLQNLSSKSAQENYMKVKNM